MKKRTLSFLLALAYCAGQAAAQQPITMIGRRDYMLPGTPQSVDAMILNEGTETGSITVLTGLGNGFFETEGLVSVNIGAPCRPET